MRIPKLTRFLDLMHGNRQIIVNARDIVQSLANRIGERTPALYHQLESAKEFIIERFRMYGANPVEETYVYDGRTYTNIIVEITGKSSFGSEIVIVGAHYDTVEGTVGANDNASGVAGILELYRLLSKHRFRRTVRFVAFTLEEPPVFGTDSMGSAVHAERCLQRHDSIRLMVSVDMIGYSSWFARQEFPIEKMKDKYPKSGDFLAVAALPTSSQYAFLWKKIHNSYSREKIFEIVAPASVEGVSLSDHISFHKAGIPALLITDTGAYRSKNYHTENDTEDTIKYWFLAHNILNIGHTLREIANRRELP